MTEENKQDDFLEEELAERYNEEEEFDGDLPIADEQEETIATEPIKKKSLARRLSFGFWILFLILLIGGIFAALVYKTSFTFSKMKFADDGNDPGLLPLHEMMPENDENRENILLLGYRGEGDPNGGLLTDTMMILSVKKSTGQVALISIPRDLFIKIPGTDIHEKINYAYAYGQEKRGQGLLYAKVAISQVTGLYIDKTALVDFEAFRDVVDTLGGIDVYLEKPFKENIQFSQEMIIDLPAGKNHLDGNQALYFVRSRYTTSDFDRARRQQQAILAIKDKAFSLGVLSNPVKIFELLSAFGKNIKTDLTLSDIKELMGIYSRLDFSHLKHKVFDTTSEGLLFSSRSEAGAYILLPTGGDYKKIQQACGEIFN